MPRGKPAMKRIEAVRHLLGTKPDREIAKLAGLSGESVRTHRLRLGIPAFRTVGSAGKDGNGASQTGSRKRARAGAPGSVASKLAPFTEIIGKVRDEQVAAEAGVTATQVQKYRAYRGIRLDVSLRRAPAFRGKVPTQEARGAGEAEPTLPADAVEETPQPDPAPPEAPRGSVGFLVNVTDGDGPGKYVVVAHDLSSAVAKALVALQSQHPEARISDISRLGRVLA